MWTASSSGFCVVVDTHIDGNVWPMRAPLQSKRRSKSITMPKKAKSKRAGKGCFQYVPCNDPEPNSKRQFVVHVKDEWEEVNGFQVFELFTFQELNEFSFGHGREW